MIALLVSLVAFSPQPDTLTLEACYREALTNWPSSTNRVRIRPLNGDRITVGVSKLGGGAGNDVGATEETIVSVTLRVVKQGTTSIEITGSPPHNPSALDSTGAVINGVNFDAAAAMIAGNG